MNLPNKLSLMRICLVPLFVVAYFLPFSWGAYVAVALFAIAALTDMLDGHIARKYNLVTNLGKLLDPVADKILACAGLLCVVATNPLQYLTYLDIGAFRPDWVVMESHAWAANFGMILLTVGSVLIIFRDFLVSGIRQVAASQGVVVQANFYGKIKTIFLDISLPLLILLQGANFDASHFYSSAGFLPSLFWVIVWWIAVVLFTISVALTVLSGFVYTLQNKKVLAN